MPFSTEVRPEGVYRVEDEASGLSAHLVIDDTTLGPAFGGIRIRAYRDATAALAEACALARAMTLKCALAELDAGGGKCVVDATRLTNRARACEVLGDFVESLGGRFRTAGDLGTTRFDLEHVASRTKYIEPPEDSDLLAEAVAVGVVAAIEAVAPRLGKDRVAGLSIAIQGLGAIGAAVTARLIAKGAKPTVTDVDPSAIARAVATGLVTAARPDEILDVDADAFVPCALGGVLDVPRAERLRARTVIGGANEILTDAAAGRVLWRRGIICAPDFLVNAGAVIRGAIRVARGVPARDDEIAAIGRRLVDVIDEAERRDLPPEVVARERAERKLAAGRQRGGDTSAASS